MLIPEKVEKNAILALEKRLMPLSVKTDIFENDKTPIEDGALYLYSSSQSQYSNDQLIGKVPIQIKGTTNVKFREKKSFILSESQLIALKKLGGLLFIIVYMDKSGANTDIVYRELSILEIDRLLKNFHGKKSKLIKFRQFPLTDSEAMSTLIRAYDEIINIGAGSVIKKGEVPKMLQVKTYGNETLSDVIGKSDIVIYGKSGDTFIPWRTFSPEELDFSEYKEVQVSVKRTAETFSSKLIKHDNYFTLLTGEEERVAIRFNSDKVNKQMKISYEKTSSVQKQENNIRVILNIISDGGLMIDNQEVQLFVIDNDKENARMVAKLKRVENRLKKVQYLQEMTHLPFFKSGLTENDNKQLNKLFYLYDHPRKLKNSGMHMIPIGDKHYYILIAKIKGRKGLLIQSLFKPDSDSQIDFVLSRPAKESIKLNPYGFAQDDIEHVGDYNPELLVEWYRRNPLQDEENLKIACDHSLKFVSIYDKTGDTSFLQAGIELAKMMLKYKKEDVYAYLNLVQAKLRVKTGLSSDVHRKLLDIVDGSDPYSAFGAAIILNLSEDEMLAHWQRLHQKDKKGIMDIPIFHLLPPKIQSRLRENL